MGMLVDGYLKKVGPKAQRVMLVFWQTIVFINKDVQSTKMGGEQWSHGFLKE